MSRVSRHLRKAGEAILAVSFFGHVLTALGLMGWLTIAGHSLGHISIPLVSQASADDLIQQIEKAEGWRPEPYTDSRGFGTFGFGTKFPITRAEGRMLLVHRLEINTRCFSQQWAGWENALPRVRKALQHAVYVLGCKGLLEFTHALQALKQRRYALAARAFRQSKWFKEESNRVELVIQTFMPN